MTKYNRIFKRIIAILLACIFVISNLEIRTEAHVMKKDAIENVVCNTHGDVSNYFLEEEILTQEQLIVTDTSVDLSKSIYFPEMNM